MKENAIKWKKIVVDVQNIMFYRRSIGLYGDFVKKINRICEDFVGEGSIGLCEKDQ